MTRNEYLTKILALCTEGEQERFKQMYPDGPSKTQIKWAIQQIENTIAVRSHVRAMYNMREAKQKIEQQEEELVTLRREVTKLTNLLAQRDKRIERLSTPENLNHATQDRLAKLDALEAAGVDNWEWYDEAMESIS